MKSNCYRNLFLFTISPSEKKFELINRPRQVLVLDDFTEIDPDRYDLDDWEHIPAPNQAKPSRRSYAKVVAAKA